MTLNILSKGSADATIAPPVEKDVGTKNKMSMT